MTDSAPKQRPFLVGIDVAKAKLDLATNASDAVKTFTNDEAGHRQIVELIAPRQPDCVVIESTGGLERPLIDALLDAGINVSLVNPANVRYLAKGLGIHAKTDAIDARTLVKFAEKATPRLLEKRPKNQAELAALVVCRRQLRETRVQQTNRRGSTRSAPAIAAIDRVIKTLDEQINDLDLQIRTLIDSDDQFKDMDRLLQTVPGLGAVTSATLISQVPELGKTDRRHAPAILGLVPHPDDSGTLNGPRSIRGGRTEPRNVIYMAALTAIRCNPVIKPFADRLRSKGKRAKVVIVACMRKLITILNAMLRDGLEWHQLQLVKSVTNP